MPDYADSRNRPDFGPIDLCNFLLGLATPERTLSAEIVRGRKTPEWLRTNYDEVANWLDVSPLGAIDGAPLGVVWLSRRGEKYGAWMGTPGGDEIPEFTVKGNRITWKSKCWLFPESRHFHTCAVVWGPPEDRRCLIPLIFKKADLGDAPLTPQNEHRVLHTVLSRRTRLDIKSTHLKIGDGPVEEVLRQLFRLRVVSV